VSRSYAERIVTVSLPVVLLLLIGCGSVDIFVVDVLFKELFLFEQGDSSIYFVVVVHPVSRGDDDV